MVVQEIFVRFRTNAREFAKQMQMPMSGFKALHNKAGQLDKTFKKNISTGQRLALGFRKGVHGMRGFRMEMLSVMFGGQMLQKAMMGLLNPALQLVGIFDLFTATLQLFFLPLAMLLLDFLLPIFDWFMNAPPWVKKAVGAFALFVLIMGAILGVVGAVVLFIGGMAIAFGSAMASAVLAVIAGIAAIIVAFIIFGKRIWEINKAVWDWLVTNVWKPIASFFKKWVIDPIATAWDWLIDKIVAGWNGIKGIWEKVTGAIDSVFGGEGEKGSRQTGGYIPHTGLYKLHEGETVNQAGNSFSPNITVNASSNVDIEMLKTQLSSAWNEDLNRMSRR